ncbi:hypothetical protein KKF05_00680 [Patescibacteria group bacterium]|nr:hypothetical protein [Patescibacteria group bacterium]
MAERYNNFLGAFDGWTLDWNAVLGLGFESAPEHWVTVYRECSIDELARVARDGLRVPSADLRHPDNRQEMELLDRFRPRHITDKGISRLKAIYAVPTPLTPRFAYKRERAILAMKVDPIDGYVGDMDFITALIPFINARGRSVEQYHGALRRYWDSVIPLTRFYRNYQHLETDHGSHWVKKRGAAARLPQTYFSPEILLMTPIINKQHVRIIRWEPEVESLSSRDWWSDPEEVWGEV